MSHLLHSTLQPQPFVQLARNQCAQGNEATTLTSKVGCCVQEWAGLQCAAPALAQGLCNAVRRQSGDSNAAQITLEGVIIAKVTPLSSSWHAWWP